MRLLLHTWIVCLLATTTSHADDKAEAAKLFELGKRHYNIGEHDEAINQFKAAYKQFPDPVYLFNIAQAYRLKGNDWCGLSAQFYSTYQREEKDKKLRDSVKKRRDEMEACAKKHPQKSEPPPAEAPPTNGTGATEPLNVGTSGQVGMVAPLAAPTTPIAPDAPANPDPNRFRRRVGIVLIGAGVVGLVFAAGYASEASKFGKQLDQCDTGLNAVCQSGDGTRLRSDVQNDYDKNYRSFGQALVVGVVSAGFGTFLYFISRKPDRPSKVTVTPTRHGAAFAWSF